VTCQHVLIYLQRLQGCCLHGQACAAAAEICYSLSLYYGTHHHTLVAPHMQTVQIIQQA
jgi:hypothetical protein